MAENIESVKINLYIVSFTYQLIFVYFLIIWRTSFWYMKGCVLKLFMVLTYLAGNRHILNSQMHYIWVNIHQESFLTYWYLYNDYDLSNYFICIGVNCDNEQIVYLWATKWLPLYSNMMSRDFHHLIKQKLLTLS